MTPWSSAIRNDSIWESRHGSFPTGWMAAACYIIQFIITPLLYLETAVTRLSVVVASRLYVVMSYRVVDIVP